MRHFDVYGAGDASSGTANTIRPTTVTYPNGRVVAYGYDASNSMADALSRVAAVIDDNGGATHLADYSYLGQQSFVETDYTQPDVKYTLVGTAGGDDPDTGDIYRGLDRFGRVKDSYWYNYGTFVDADRIKYGYDRSGSRLWRENTVARSLGKYFDEKYLYDEIHRLKDMQRGELNNLQSAISNLQFSQCWGLDETGNWSNFREDDDGSGSWDLNQTRTSNTVNEITDISETAGASWVTPIYSRAGNMTTMPQPASPASSYTATYDAWNRLVKIADGGNSVSEDAYDGAKRRIVQKSYVSGTLNETRHLYYTEPSKWQVVEERIGTSTSANRQFVWGLRYVDDLILRDRDTDGNGTLDERLYSLQDANWNVTGLINTSGTVQQRCVYTAYGLPVFLNSSFVAGSNTAGWEVLYAGYRFEAATSLMHVRHRVLNAAMGCWLQRDPVGYFDTSMYQYADDSPLLKLDPQGLAPWILVGCVGGGIVSTFRGWSDCGSWWTVSCNAIVGCLVGANFANFLLIAPPKFKTCIAGLGFGLVSEFVPFLCKKLNDEPTSQSGACQAAKALYFGLLGCLIKALGPGMGNPEKAMAMLDAALGKWTIDRICKAVG